MTILRAPFTPVRKASAWWNRLIEPYPSVQDADTRQKSRLLASMLLTLLLIILTLYLVRLPLHPSFDWEVVSRLVLGVIVLICYPFCHKGYYKAICLSAAIAGSLALFSLATVQGGPSALYILNYLVIVLIFVSLFMPVRVTLAIFAAQMGGLILWAGLVNSPTRAVLDAPFSFNLALGLIILMAARHRDLLEAARQAQLKASEAQFRALIEQTPVAIAVVGEMQFKYVNDAFAQMHGYEKAEELIGQPPLDRIAPDYRAAVTARSAHPQPGLMSGTAHEVVNLRNDGTPFYGLGTTTRVQLADGPVTIAFVQDITERKQTEIALQESEERYRRLIETSPDGVLVHQHGTIVFANPAALALYGADTPADLIGKTMLSRVHPDYQPVIAERIRRIVGAKGQVPFLEQKHLRLDGSVIDVEVAGASFSLHGELAVQIVIRDITERKQMAELLTQERNLLRTLIDNLPDFIYVKDRGSRFVTTNVAHLAVLGAATLDDVVGKTDFDLFPPELASRYFDDEQQIMQSGKPLLAYEEPIRGDSGTERWAVSTKLPLRDTAGNMIGLVGITRDITEQRHTILALKESEAKFRAFVEQSADGITLVDEQGNIVEWNAANERLTDQSRDTVVGQPYWDFHFRMLPPEKRSPAMYESLKTTTLTILQTGQSPLLTHPVEARQICPDGTIRTALQTIFPIKTEQGYRIGSISQDITDRKLAEEALRQSEARHRALLTAIPDLIFRKHRDGTFLDYHAGSLVDLAAPPDQIIGRKTAEVLPPESAERHQRAVERALETGEMQTYEYTLPINGQLMDYEARMVVCGPDEVITIVRNITERKRTQQQAFELALERQRVSVLETFIQDASHDLKTPLSVVQLSAHMLRRITDRMFGQVEALSQCAATSPVQLATALTEITKNLGAVYQRIDSLEGSAQRLNYLVSSLLEITRLQHYPNVHRSPQNLNSMVSELISNYQPLAVAKEQVLQFEPDNTLPSLMLDPDNFPRVIENLVKNAVQYTPQWGRIRVSTYQQDQQAVLEVSDTGIGIVAADLPRVFERFYRADKARSTTNGGAGLGLAITKHIVEAHGGQVVVESTPGAGSTFRVSLPIEG